MAENLIDLVYVQPRKRSGDRVLDAIFVSFLTAVPW
jgi:hypothetical protein